MTDRRFYLFLALVLLALAGGEIVYAMVGPLSEPTGQLDEFSSDSDGKRPPNPIESDHPVDGVIRGALTAV